MPCWTLRAVVNVISVRAGKRLQAIFCGGDWGNVQMALIYMDGTWVMRHPTAVIGVDSGVRDHYFPRVRSEDPFLWS